MILFEERIHGIMVYNKLEGQEKEKLFFASCIISKKVCVTLKIHTPEEILKAEINFTKTTPNNMILDIIPHWPEYPIFIECCKIDGYVLYKVDVKENDYLLEIH